MLETFWNMVRLVLLFLKNALYFTLQRVSVTILMLASDTVHERSDCVAKTPCGRRWWRPSLQHTEDQKGRSDHGIHCQRSGCSERRLIAFVFSPRWNVLVVASVCGGKVFDDYCIYDYGWLLSFHVFSFLMVPDLNHVLKITLGIRGFVPEGEAYDKRPGARVVRLSQVLRDGKGTWNGSLFGIDIHMKPTIHNCGWYKKLLWY